MEKIRINYKLQTWKIKDKIFKMHEPIEADPLRISFLDAIFQQTSGHVEVCPHENLFSVYIVVNGQDS